LNTISAPFRPRHLAPSGKCLVADVEPNLAVSGVEDRITEVARLEKELLPEAGNLRDVHLAVFAEVTSVRVDHRGRVVVHAGHVLLVDRHDDDHAVLLRVLAHQLGGRAVRNGFGGLIPLGVLGRAEVRAGEDLLETQHLHALAGRLFNVGQVGFNHRLAVFLHRRVGVELVGHLNESGLEGS
jgi:hypothetical protein